MADEGRWARDDGRKEGRRQRSDISNHKHIFTVLHAIATKADASVVPLSSEAVFLLASVSHKRPTTTVPTF